jgi:murein DD-endopeptidase MepM/ murein hydrolase activator NlpD
MRKSVVGFVVASIGFASFGGVASGLDTSWPAGINSGAQNIPANTQAVQMVFPIVGNSIPDGPGGPADDLCAGNTQSYSNTYCRPTAPQHSGEDLYTHSGTYAFQVVAAIGGTIDQKGCGSGSGYRIDIKGNDGHYYRYFHLANNSSSLQVGNVVAAGQKLATQGNTTYCTASGVTGTTVLHTHFDRMDNKACSNASALCGRDTYPSLRKSDATPGLMPDGHTTDNRIYARWGKAIAPTGSNFVAAMLFVGWPSNGSYITYVANVLPLTSSAGSPGRSQHLSNGSNGDGHWRGGVLMDRDGDSEAYYVYGGWYTKYAALTQQAGYLGWPISDANSSFQLFEGGCIFNQSGSYNAYHWGTSPCVLF